MSTYQHRAHKLHGPSNTYKQMGKPTRPRTCKEKVHSSVRSNGPEGREGSSHLTATEREASPCFPQSAARGGVACGQSCSQYGEAPAGRHARRHTDLSRPQRSCDHTGVVACGWLQRSVELGGDTCMGVSFERCFRRDAGPPGRGHPHPSPGRGAGLGTVVVPAAHLPRILTRETSYSTLLRSAAMASG